jgi:hypothetical protein
MSLDFETDPDPDFQRQLDRFDATGAALRPDGGIR